MRIILCGIVWHSICWGEIFSRLAQRLLGACAVSRYAIRSYVKSGGPRFP